MRTEKLKYWLLTTEYPPEYGGGISTYAHYTAKMLSKNHHKVSVFVYDLRVKDVLVEYSENIRIIRFNPNKTNTDFWDFMQTLVMNMLLLLETT
jgi:hypothetical protein